MVYKKPNGKEIILHPQNAIGGMLQMMFVHFTHDIKVLLFLTGGFVVYGSTAYFQ